MCLAFAGFVSAMFGSRAMLKTFSDVTISSLLHDKSLKERLERNINMWYENNKSQNYHPF